jgi:G patch domain and KOW motifs-containing protein
MFLVINICSFHCSAPMLEAAKELIIPLPPQSSISDKIAQLVDTKRKLRKIGNLPVQPRPEAETIEQRAAREIEDDLRRQDLVAAESVDNGRVVKPLNPDELPLDGGVEPSQDDYDNMPVDNFGLAMLRGMGFKGDLKKVGLDVEDAPMARPKGMGLGVDRARLAQQASATTTKEGDEKLELKKNAFAKIISGKMSGSYGVVSTHLLVITQSNDVAHHPIHSFLVRAG